MATQDDFLKLQKKVEDMSIEMGKMTTHYAAVEQYMKSEVEALKMEKKEMVVQMEKEKVEMGELIEKIKKEVEKEKKEDSTGGH